MNILPSAMIKKPILRLKRGSKAYKDLQKAVLERDNYTCQECGKSVWHPILRSYAPPHHKIKLSQCGSDTLENMEAICMNCHAKEH